MASLDGYGRPQPRQDLNTNHPTQRSNYSNYAILPHSLTAELRKNPLCYQRIIIYVSFVFAN